MRLQDHTVLVSVVRILRQCARVPFDLLIGFYALTAAAMLYVLYGIDAVSTLLFHQQKRAARWILKVFGAEVGDQCDIESQLIIHSHGQANFSDLKVGNGCHIGRHVFLDLASPIVLEDRATISMKVTIITHLDVGKSPLAAKGYPYKCGSVCIGMGAYIGAGAIILPGVKVGNCAVIGAGAVVTKDVKPFTVVAGVPAKEIRKLQQ